MRRRLRWPLGSCLLILLVMSGAACSHAQRSGIKASVVAIDVETGQTRWLVQVDATRLGVPTLAGGTLSVAALLPATTCSQTGEFLTFDTTTGSATGTPTTAPGPTVNT